MNWRGANIKGAVWILGTLIAMLITEKSTAQGLGFFSNELPVGERTSYEVLAKRAGKFNKHLNISFELSFYSKQQFGYIFTLVDPRNKSYTLSFRLQDDQTPWLHFNIDKEATKLKIPLQKSWLENGTWIPISLEFDLEADKVTLTINGKAYQSNKLELQPGMEPKLIFGRYTTYTDVPAMAIRQLQLTGADQELVFPLNEWEGQEVHAANGNATGRVDNPNWLIKEAHYWKKRWSYAFPKIAGANFVPDQNSIVAFTADSLLSWQLATGTITRKAYANKLPISKLLLARSAWDAARQQLWVYEANNLPIADTTIAALDIDAARWTSIGTAYLPEQRHHHNLVQYDSSWVLFGGYGSFHYFNGFYRYNSVTDQWQPLTLNGDSIHPRFFAAMGATGKPGEYLLFGGFGNPTGEQVVGGRNYFDCYRIHLSQQRIQKLWEKSIPNELWVPASNLLMDASGNHFYVLGYPHHLPKSALQLYKFSVATGQFDLVSDSIPITSEKIETEINLYRNQQLGELVCLVQEFSSSEASTVSVYTLKDPPVAFNATPLSSPSATSRAKYWLLLLLVPLASFWWFRKKKPPVATPENTNDAEAAVPEIASISAPQRNAVYLLGEFQAFDKKGIDISHHFSPKIRQLFLLLIVIGRSGKKGITSRLISATLWPDRDMASTKNIRGVTINNLRNILAEWEGIQLSFQNDSYVLDIQPGFFCDYYTMLDALNANTTHPISLLYYLPLLQRGSLFSNTQEPFLDEYKFEFETLLADAAAQELLQAIRANTMHLPYYQLSKQVHLADPFHEPALSYQLIFLRKTKGVEASRKKFEAFQAEYERSLGHPYTPTYEQAAQI